MPDQPNRPIAPEPLEILVPGGAGYLGSHLIRQLLERGHKVRILERFLFGMQSIEEIRHHKNLQILEGDIRDVRTVMGALEGCDTVVLLASLVGEKACDADPVEAMGVNYVAPVAMVEAARKRGVKRFIFASTDSAYGIQEGILYEDSPMNPISLYARLKAETERKVLALAGDDFTPCVLRLATLYGLSPRMRFDLIINILTMHAVAKGKFTIYGGKQWRPLVHVADAARAFVMAAEAPIHQVKGEVFNVGSNEQNRQIYQLGDVVSKVIPQAQRMTTDVPPDLRDYHVNFDKIAKVLGFKTTRTIEDGIREIRDAIRNGTIADPFEKVYCNA